MSGTFDGGKKASQKNREKDPNFYAKIGGMGGRNSRGYPFGHGKVDPSAIGKKGGLNGKRKRKLTDSQVRIVRISFGTTSVSELARKFNVSRPTITGIKNGFTYKEVV